MKKIMFIYVVCACLLSAAFAQSVSIEKETENDFKLSKDQNVRIRNSFGDVNVSGSGEDAAVIHAKISVKAPSKQKAQALLDKIEVEMGMKGNTLEVISKIDQNTIRNASFTVDITAKIPRGIDLDVENQFGDTKVIDTQSAVKATSRNGDLEVENCRSTNLDNSFGNVLAVSINGRLDLVCRNGDVRVTGVKGACYLDNQFGNTTVSDITDALTLSSKNGNIELKDVASAEVHNAFGNLKASNLKGDLGCNMANGAIKIDNVDGSAKINSSFGEIDVAEVRGNLSIASNNGNITIKNIAKTVDVKNSFGDITLTGANANVVLDNANGNINVDQVKAQLNASSKFGSITGKNIMGPVFAKNANGNIDLENIDSPIDAQTSFANAEFRNVCPSIRCYCQNGDIRIAGLKSGNANLLLGTSFGGVDVEMPKDFQGEIKLQTTFGSINTGGIKGSYSKTYTSEKFETLVGEKKGIIQINATNSGIRLR